MMDTRKKTLYFGFMPQEVEVNGQPALYFANGHLEIMEKDEFERMIKMAKQFYEADGVEAWIKKENMQRRWLGHPIMGTTIVNEKYVLPEPSIQQREFRKNLKKNWGFLCDWCNHKVSSKVDTVYYHINEHIMRNRRIHGQCCSQACAENLWYDVLIEMIKEENLTDVFHTDKTIKAPSI